MISPFKFDIKESKQASENCRKEVRYYIVSKYPKDEDIICQCYKLSKSTMKRI